MSPAAVGAAGPPAPAHAPTERGRRRREAILDAATALFDERGYPGTSIDDIGAAAGITGPGLYRHFASKDAILTAVFDRLWRRLRPAVEAADVLAPVEALDTLIDAHVDLAIGDPAAIMLLLRELRHVPEDYQRTAVRTHRRYVDAWVRPLRAWRPEVSPGDARTTALAVHGLIDSAAVTPDAAPGATRRDLLRRLARTALGM